LNKHWNGKVRHAQRVRNRAFVTEIRKRDDDSINGFAMLLEKVGAACRFLARFDGAVLGIRFTERDDFYADGFKGGDHFLAAAASQVIWKKSTVAYD
jgi:hypothetical protein